jgi:nitrogen-specific signal transduction histidine kinase/CheY-like chemotaxis protein
VQNRLLDPAVKGLVVNLRDITAEQHLGDQLRQSQKLEAIGRLTGGIAHDFNNVLTVILSHAAYLLEDLPMPDPRRRDAEGIRAAAERAASLTRQLLAFARKQVLAPRVLDLNQVIAGLAPMLRRVIGEDILLSIDAAPQLGATRADAGQLEQVILNLAVNARDAMPTGGRFSLATSEITLDAGQLLAHPGCAPGRYVALTVRDTGAGMSAEVQQHLFEPFFTTKEQGKGTGLGLSTVLGIVEQSGGLVLVESGPGRGATFRIYLPRVDASPELVEPGPGPRTLRGHETILVVDDDEQVRRTAARILSSRGYRVLMAPSAREALAVVEDSACAVELVISDIVMPGQSGPELLEQLRARCPSLRVLFMSGFTEHAVVEKTLAAGADYLQKPFTPDTLAQRTRAILDRPAPVAR